MWESRARPRVSEMLERTFVSMMNTQRVRSITRLKSREAWRLQFHYTECDGAVRVYRRQFADSRFGGTDGALRAAVLERDRAFALFGRTLENLGALSVRRHSRRNSTGIVGVSRLETNGRVTWAAFWRVQMPDGRIASRSRTFAESKYGADEARRLAIEARSLGVDGYRTATLAAPVVEPDSRIDR